MTDGLGWEMTKGELRAAAVSIAIQKKKKYIPELINRVIKQKFEREIDTTIKVPLYGGPSNIT